MVEQHKTKVVAVVLATTFLLELAEESFHSLLHSCPILSDIWEHEGLNVTTLHSHLTLTLHEILLDTVSDVLIFPLVEENESLL